MRESHRTRQLKAREVARITDSALLSFRGSLAKQEAKMKAQAASAREAEDRPRSTGADPIIAEHLKRWHDRLKAEGKLSDVTVERLEWALALAAYLISLDGPKMVPLFERLERELAAMRQVEDSVERAKRMLEFYGGQPPIIVIAPPLLALAPPLDDGVHSTAAPRPQP